MASITPTTCPQCGGRADFHADDGVTYCREPKCKAMDAEYPDYKPPDRRGGRPLNGRGVGP